MRKQGYRVTVTLRPANYEVLSRLADATGRTMSAIVDALIQSEMPRLIQMLDEQRRITEMLRSRRLDTRPAEAPAGASSELNSTASEDYAEGGDEDSDDSYER